MSTAFSGRREGIDSFDAQFWDERFEASFTPWDHGGVPAELQHFVASAAAPRSTLIPGCGFAHELAYFRNAGWPATAIDFSAAAVKQAQRISPAWQADIVQADFFQFQPAQALTLIYERAFFCALPPDKRHAIVQRWAQLLAPQGLLAATFLSTMQMPSRPQKARHLVCPVMHYMASWLIILSCWKHEVPVSRLQCFRTRNIGWYGNAVER